MKGDTMKSWKAEVIADSTGEWVGNGLRFETREEAEQYVLDLSMRWTLVRFVRTVQCEGPVNAKFKDGRTEHLKEIA